VNPRLLDLLESGKLDWDNPRHREAYLRAWVKGDVKPYSHQVSSVEQGSSGSCESGLVHSSGTGSGTSRP
jgi:ATP-dependent helicase YprA (DUF1998 family)